MYTLGPITSSQILEFDLPRNPMGVWTTYLEFGPIIIIQYDEPALPSQPYFLTGSRLAGQCWFVVLNNYNGPKLEI